MRSRFCVASLAWVLGFTTLLAADEPLFSYKGDGLTINVSEWSDETGDVKGVILRDKETWPFKGKVDPSKEDTINGTFTAFGTEFQFTSKLDMENDSVTFISGGTTYKLKAVGESTKETPKAEVKPENPFSKPNVDAPRPLADVKNAAEMPAVLKLKQHVFPDVTMGAPAAYTALIPADWTADGNIEWRNIGEVPFPQTKFTLTSPDGGKAKFVPNVVFYYVDAPGLGKRDGEPAPENFPEWLPIGLSKYNKTVSNVRLVTSKRNEQLEATLAKNDRETGAITQGQRRECWVIVIDYDEAGVHRREESSITYVAFPPFNGLNGFFTQSWGMFCGPLVSAPVETFEAQKPLLYQVAGTIQPTLKWFTASQAVIAQNARQRSERIWDSIRRRGEQINQMHVTKSDEDAYSKSIGSDANQRQRINSIYETDDYKDTNGQTVNLPMHYKNVFSDGKGNYVLSNNSQDKPGELWDNIEPIKRP